MRKSFSYPTRPSSKASKNGRGPLNGGFYGHPLPVSHRTLNFLKEALPIFIFSAVGLFIFDKTGLLGLTKQAMTPMIVNWMGLPKDIIDVFLLALARREAAAGLILKMVDAGSLNYIQSILAVIVTTISFPCVANVIAIGREMGWKTALLMTTLIFVSSFILVGALRWVLVLVCH